MRIVLALLAVLATAAGGVVATRPEERGCVHPDGVANVSFSATKYPHIRRHYEAAVAAGWPRVLVLRRDGADTRRSRLLDGYDTRSGLDRDEYPPAVARSGWRASVAYVPSHENRSHGAVLGTKLRRFCNGTRFRYVFY
ncbi:MAG TPA: NucA/NucB deoxyribonuclease domain-containing protein [Solirubrobacter sp.]|nr:NucA/NucB deoxyribonuclease domain-containing protein [Solirubrobacter sp.]